MAKVNVYNMEGAVTGEIELSDAIFGLETVNESVVHQVVKAILANKRQGTSATKTRSFVRGGGRRPYRQKGTGRARQGSIRSAQWIGGGVIFGPQPRSYRQSVPKKMRRLAMKSVLTSKVNEDRLIVVENLDLAEVKTKVVANIVSKLPVKKEVLLVDVAGNKNLYLSSRNIKEVGLSWTNTLNVVDLVKYGYVVFTKEAIKHVEEVFA